MVADRTREILVIHPGALGDVLQAVPALTGLRELDGVERLCLAGQARLVRLLAGTGLVDEAVSFDGLGLESLFAGDFPAPSLRSRLARFDRVACWFGSGAHPFPEGLRGIVRETLLAPPIPEADSSAPVWKYLLGTLAPWGVNVPVHLVPLNVPETWRAEARGALSRLGWDQRQSSLFVHPGAGGQDKRWPAESFARVIREVARETGCQILVHQGPADGEAVDQLLGLLDFPVVRLVEPPLHLLAGVLRDVSVYLGGDSGVSHLAASVGASAVIVFPSATRDRWAPWSPTALPLTASPNSADEKIVVSAVIERLA